MGDVGAKRVRERVRQRLRTMDVLVAWAARSSSYRRLGVPAGRCVGQALWQILREEPIQGAGTITASFGVTDGARERVRRARRRRSASTPRCIRPTGGCDRVVIAP